MHHVAVQVEDVARAVEWYRSVFACEVEYQDATWAMLAFANLRVALVVPAQHPPHLSLVRADAAKFGPLTGHRDGTRSVYVVDPWGNSIEIMDRDSLPPEG
ncbi:MAG: VOC family protein [Planctomycetes bacterium]|nr:VOC family protein [Planctomycetota bacterium]